MPFYIKFLDRRLFSYLYCIFFRNHNFKSRRDLATFWGLSIFFFMGSFTSIRYRNRNDEASIFASYLVGMEVALRTVGATVIWEYGKYSTIFLLVTGMVIENLKFLRINVLSLTYFACLLPAIGIMPEVPLSSLRRMISGNLSGPLCLFISFLYFRNRNFSRNNILNIFKCLSLQSFH